MSVRSTFVLIAVLLLLGCAGDSEGPVNVEWQQPPAFSVQFEPSPQYRLEPWDSFSLVVYRRTDTAPLISLKDVQLDANGDVVLPMFGKIRVAGLTIGELEGRLYELFSREFVEPRLQVLGGKSRRLNAYVLGEVKAPGIFQLPRSVSVLEIVLMAKGFTPDADQANIVLLRPAAAGHASAQGTVASTDLSRLLAEARFTQNVQVQPGDIVYVPPDKIARRDRLFKHVLNVMQPFIAGVQAIGTIYVVSGASTTK